jgi:hypothetical protein
MPHLFVVLALLWLAGAAMRLPLLVVPPGEVTFCLKVAASSGEQRKLLLSVGTNFLTRIPGAIGLLWFLPLLRFGLGTDDYANLLASMALASAAAFQSGGFNLIGRRLIGEAYSNGDQVGEANALANAVIANAGAASLTLAIIATYCWVRSTSIDFLIVSSLSATGIWFPGENCGRRTFTSNPVPMPGTPRRLPCATQNSSASSLDFSNAGGASGLRI